MKLTPSQVKYTHAQMLNGSPWISHIGYEKPRAETEIPGAGKAGTGKVTPVKWLE